MNFSNLIDELPLFFRFFFGMALGLGLGFWPAILALAGRVCLGKALGPGFLTGSGEFKVSEMTFCCFAR